MHLQKLIDCFLFMLFLEAHKLLDQIWMRLFVGLVFCQTVPQFCDKHGHALGDFSLPFSEKLDLGPHSFLKAFESLREISHYQVCLTLIFIVFKALQYYVTSSLLVD